jgi:23S rRNA pseudouridine1911/1915/1917 synthase
MLPSHTILYEDNHCLAVNKPAGLSTAQAQAGTPSLDVLARQYLKLKYSKQGNVFLGVVHRLDRDVSGVVLLARTSKAAARLSEQFRSRSIHKIYWAVVEGEPHTDTGKLTHWLYQGEEQRVRIVAAEVPGARQASLTYSIRQRTQDLTLLEIKLETGRKHQIRVQLAAIGCPILGDRKYGSRRHFPSGIALHARSLQFLHPTRAEPITLTAPLPPAWESLRIHLIDREPG